MAAEAATPFLGPWGGAVGLAIGAYSLYSGLRSQKESKALFHRGSTISPEERQAMVTRRDVLSYPSYALDRHGLSQEERYRNA